MKHTKVGLLAVLVATLLFSTADQGRAALTDDLVAYYSFDDGTAKNLSANGATLDGTVGPNVTPAAGILGQSFSFPGVQDVNQNAIVVPDQPLLDITGGITLSGWVHTTSLNRQVIVTKLASGNNNYLLEQLNRRGNFAINTHPYPGGVDDLFGITPINTGNWVHVVGTYDGASQKLYVNGVLDRQRSNSGPLFTNNIPLVIGNWWSATRPFTGEIDEVGVWSRALSETEILELYNNGNGFNPVPANQPPDCSQAAPSVAVLWPPNHRMVDVSILGVTDPDGDAVTVTITGITQDEPVNGTGDGDTGPDGAGVGSSTAQVRAERSGVGNGRVYEVSFTADDGKGGTCDGSVKVGVPHDQGKGKVPIDDGQAYNSLAAGKPIALEFAPEADLTFGAENYPNPFNPSTTIRYTLPEASSVRLTIYNVLGQEVRTLVNAAQSRGVHSVQWDGRDASGRQAATGVYIYRLEAGRFVATRNMVFAK
jgi:hypothetical protein